MFTIECKCIQCVLVMGVRAITIISVQMWDTNRSNRLESIDSVVRDFDLSNFVNFSSKIAGFEPA